MTFRFFYKKGTEMVIVMNKKRSEKFMKKAVLGFLSGLFIASMSGTAFADIDDEIEAFDSHEAIASLSSAMDQSSFMSFALEQIGEQTVSGPAAQGLNAGDTCDSADCLGNNLHVRAFANSDKYRSDDDFRFKADNAGAIAAFSNDRIYDSFDARYTLFGGYILSRTKFDGVGLHQENNTPVAGFAAEFYKGRFFGGFVLNGAYVHSKTLVDGGEDMSSDSWMGGAGVKAGYNLNVLDVLTIQPNAKASYRYFKGETQKLSNGEKLKFHSDNDVELIPGLKASLNLGKCWTFSGMGNYVWAYETESHVKADSTADGELNYVEYGAGLEKKWSSVILSANGKHRDGKRNGWYADLNLEVRF
jgi:hypothetical protein